MPNYRIGKQRRCIDGMHLTEVHPSAGKIAESLELCRKTVKLIWLKNDQPAGEAVRPFAKPVTMIDRKPGSPSDERPRRRL
jgi:hypothetical protein